MNILHESSDFNYNKEKKEKIFKSSSTSYRHAHFESNRYSISKKKERGRFRKKEEVSSQQRDSQTRRKVAREEKREKEEEKDPLFVPDLPARLLPQHIY